MQGNLSFFFLEGSYQVDPHTLIVDVYGNIKISGDFPSFFCPAEIAQIMGGKKFGTVTGDFIMQSQSMETLEGSPDYVGGDFNISYNKIKSLDSCPTFIGGDFVVTENAIESPVANHPLNLKGDVFLYSNPLGDKFENEEDERKVFKDILLYFNSCSEPARSWEVYNRVESFFF